MTAKQKQGLWKLLELGGTIISVIIAATIAWQTLKGEVCAARRGVNTNLQEISAMDQRVHTLENFMAEQRVHNAWMKETLTDIKEAVKK